MIYVVEVDKVGGMAEKHERLRDARRNAGFETASAAAKALGISASTYRAHENGQNEFHMDDAKRYGTRFSVDPIYLLTGERIIHSDVQPNPNILESPNALIRDRLKSEGHPIPVYGRAVGGVSGEFEMNGSLMGHVLAPPQLSEARKAYAVSISGDSMSPRFEENELVFVDPNKRIKKGDYVVVQIQSEENGPLLAFVKRFCRRNSEELVLEQLNPAKEMRFPESSVVSVHYIAGMLTDALWQ
jgi:phage repressor protein C with HTH and peptisase S24 domain